MRAYRWLAVLDVRIPSTQAQSLNIVDFGVHDVHGVAGDCLLTDFAIPSARDRRCYCAGYFRGSR